MSKANAVVFHLTNDAEDQIEEFAESSGLTGDWRASRVVKGMKVGLRVGPTILATGTVYRIWNLVGGRVLIQCEETERCRLPFSYAGDGDLRNSVKYAQYDEQLGFNPNL